MDIKAQQTRHWNAVAGGWGAWFDWTSRNFQPVADWCGSAAGWRPGARVLDVGCGSGFPAFAAAAAVRPGGTVVAVDISPEMVAVAARRAEAAGFDNITCAEMDAEDLHFDDGAFDAVTNTYGLMFCPDLPRALDESRRVLKAGGRFAAVTWDHPSKSPFFSVITSAVAPVIPIPPPPPSTPGPFRLSSPAELESLLSAAGFSDVRVAPLLMACEFASADEYFQVFSEVAWKAKVAALSDTDRVRALRAIAEAVRPFTIDGRIRLPAASWCASCRK